MVTGYAGQLSLCQFALAGLGSWVCARLVAAAGVPFEVAIALALGLTVLAGCLVALVALRTRGTSLAVATLGLAFLIQDLILNNAPLTGGFLGTVVKNVTFFGWNVDPIEHPQAYGVLVFIGFLGAGLLVANLRRGQAGRRLLAVRSNERAAASLGVGIYGAKVYAFGLGAALASLAGISLAFMNEYIVFQQFDVFGSITAVQYAVVGGIGWAGGAFIGALLAPGTLLTYVLGAGTLSDIGSWLLVVAGVTTLSILAIAPDGVAAVIARAARRFVRRPQGVASSTSGPHHPVTSLEALPPRNRVRMELRDVTVRFGGVTALDCVSITVNPSETVGLIGPNGAGKTTLLDAATGFAQIASGTVLMNGTPVERWSPEKRARAGLGRSFQSVELFEDLTVRDNLLIAADRKSPSRYLTDLVHPGRPTDTAALEFAVTDFALRDVLDKLPRTLSHGTSRLVGIARAVVAEPAILFLDEPAAGLDSKERDELRSLIQRLNSQFGIAIVLVEHDVSFVMAVCSRVVVLDFGRQIAERNTRRGAGQSAG